MKRIEGCFVALAIAGAVSSGFVALPRAAGAEVSLGVSVGDDGLESFHLAISERYRVPRATVAAVRARRIPDDDLPIVFSIAERARCTPEAIVELRLGGKSWMDIGLHFGLTAAAFYVEVEGDHRPPYGRALGHFKNRDRARWGEIRLSDEDIACLVQLQFLSERHKCSALDVIRARERGEGLVALHGKLQSKGAGATEAPARGAESGSPGNGANEKAASGAAEKGGNGGAPAKGGARGASAAGGGRGGAQGGGRGGGAGRGRR